MGFTDCKSADCIARQIQLNSLPDTVNPNQLLFGINQGAVYADIRIDHAKRISELLHNQFVPGTYMQMICV